MSVPWMSGRYKGLALAELTASHDFLSVAHADENCEDVFARSPAAGVRELPRATAAKLARDCVDIAAAAALPAIPVGLDGPVGDQSACAYQAALIGQ